MSEEHILRGAPTNTNWSNASLGEFMWKCIRSHGSKVALIGSHSKEQITFNEIFNKSQQLANALKEFGVKQNDVVGICSENTLLYAVALLAPMYIGASVATFNADYSINELKHAASLSKPTVFICSQHTYNSVEEVVKTLPGTRLIMTTANDKGIPYLEEIMKGRPVVCLPVIYKDASKHLAFVLCSSGTTGLPKGVMLMDSNVIATLMQSEYMKGEFPPVEELGVQLGLLPLYHSFGLNVLLRLLMNGCTTVLMTAFEPDVFLQTIQDYKIRICSLVPPLVAFLAKHPMIDEYDLSSLETVLSGAAPLSKDLQDALLKRLPSIKRVIQGYGLTESTQAVFVEPYNSPRTGSSGKVLPGLEVKVIDPETGKSLGPRKEGELCVRGAVVMKGYIGNPKATAETIDRDGWLHTGDVAYYDEDGYFYIVDRIKELIKYKGFQVPPAELEAILITHSEVQDAAVIGIPDDFAGELPKAYVVKNGEVTEQELIDYVKKHVSSAKWLRGGVEFIDEIPRNPTGKILRKELRNRLKSKL